MEVIKESDYTLATIKLQEIYYIYQVMENQTSEILTWRIHLDILFQLYVCLIDNHLRIYMSIDYNSLNRNSRVISETLTINLPIYIP